MKKTLFTFLSFLLLFTACSEDISTAEQMESDLVGVWVPSPPSNYPDLYSPLVLYFNSDGSGSYHRIISIDKDGYDLNKEYSFSGYNIKKGNDSQAPMHFYYLNHINPVGGESLNQTIAYLSKDSLSIQTFYPDSRLYPFKKVSSIKVK